VNNNSSLSARHLAKAYKTRHVISDVSLQVSRGEIVGLLGPNGAGKTTCFYMMVGLIPADKGEILLNNENITDLPMHRRAQLGIGYLPQEASVFRKLSTRNNILAILETRKGLGRKQQICIADELMEELHITHIANSLGMSLSGGERRRVEIARALASDPQFILLDEPFAGVDPISVADIKKIIYHLQSRNIGILITDHNVRETLSICQRAYIVGEGQIIAEGSSDEILQNAKVRKVYLGEDFSL
jgi:lipopolysaccharide export system ATP-binding protein